MRWIDEVLEHALQYQPTPLKGEKKAKRKKEAKQEESKARKEATQMKFHYRKELLMSTAEMVKLKKRLKLPDKNRQGNVDGNDADIPDSWNE